MIIYLFYSFIHSFIHIFIQFIHLLGNIDGFKEIIQIFLSSGFHLTFIGEKLHDRCAVSSMSHLRF